MPYTITGDYYRELGGSPTYQKSKDSAAGSDTWMMPWVAAFQFANYVVPEPIQVGPFTIHPVTWGFRYDGSLRAESVDVSPWYGEEPGMTGISEASDWAKVKVSYKTPEEPDEEEEDEDDPETFLTHKITIGAEMMTVPPRMVLTENASTVAPDVEDIMTDEDAPITLLMPTAEHQLTWKKVLSPPFGAIYDSIGKINSNAFLNAKVGTLMFLGVDANREFTTGGQKPWTLDYRFSHRVALPANVVGAPFGWNHFYVPKLGIWVKLRFNGEHAYQSVDFQGLFT
jgi:hypothetical protein